MQGVKIKSRNLNKTRKKYSWRNSDLPPLKEKLNQKIQLEVQRITRCKKGTKFYIQNRQKEVWQRTGKETSKCWMAQKGKEKIWKIRTSMGRNIGRRSKERPQKITEMEITKNMQSYQTLVAHFNSILRNIINYFNRAIKKPRN